jgi:hypothetical protein
MACQSGELKSVEDSTTEPAAVEGQESRVVPLPLDTISNRGGCNE